MTDPSFPIVVPATAFRPVLTAIVRQVLTIAGTALVARGILTQGAADSFISDYADQIVGLAIVGASAGWAWWKARHTTAKMQAMEARLPDTIATTTTKGA